MKCSYSASEMRFVTLQVKRRVPAGAKDLGIADEVTCWRCPKCEQIVAKCGACNADVDRSVRYWTVCDKCGHRECNHCSPKHTKYKKCNKGFMQHG
jgi:hypothetical protein